MITCISEKEEVLGKAYEERNKNFKQDKGYTNCRKFKKNNTMKNIKWNLGGTFPGFCSMKRLMRVLLPLDGMLVHRRSLPRDLLGFPNNLPVTIYTPGWREALWELCLAQEHNSVPG